MCEVGRVREVGRYECVKSGSMCEVGRSTNKQHAPTIHALAPEEAPPRDEVAVVADKECGDGAEQTLIYAQQDERRAKEPRGEDKEPRAQLALLVDVGLRGARLSGKAHNIEAKRKADKDIEYIEHLLSTEEAKQ